MRWIVQVWLKTAHRVGYSVSGIGRSNIRRGTSHSARVCTLCTALFRTLLQAESQEAPADDSALSKKRERQHSHTVAAQLKEHFFKTSKSHLLFNQQINQWSVKVHGKNAFTLPSTFERVIASLMLKIDGSVISQKAQCMSFRIG